jgi:hypothetical protein
LKDFDRILPIKRAAQGRLLTLPGVHSVGIGLKIVAGQRTEEPAIMVFVVRKRSLPELRPDEVIPPEIEGVKTDVYEADIARSRGGDRPLLGGVSLEPGGVRGAVIGGTFAADASGLGGYGTLGCLALTGGAHPSLVAITCLHVLSRPVRGATTDLRLDSQAPNLVFSGSNTANSFINLIAVSGKALFNVFYRTSTEVTPEDVAAAFAKQITAAGIPGLTATVTPPGSATVNLVSSGAGPSGYNCTIYNPPTGFARAGIKATPANTTISLSGEASQACGAYVTFNVGGPQPTHGTFVAIAAGADAGTVAGSIRSALTRLATQVNALSGVTASVAPPASPDGQYVVSVGGVQEVDCLIASDARVGQPDNSFCSKCSKCCDHLIGVVIAARADLDVALIQIDPAHVDKYVAEIKGIGAVKGPPLDITKETSGYPLQKYGMTTSHTSGTLLSLDQTGFISDADPSEKPQWTVFHRYYTGAFSIQGDAGTVFASTGDSGSAVVTHPTKSDGTANVNDPDYNKIAGILFATGTTSNGVAVGFATPILPILSAFPDLSLTLATATATGLPLPVPPLAAPAAQAPAAASADLEPAARLAQVQQEITVTAAGQRYSELVQRHFAEVQTLVNQNRRVATVWRRNGGPEIAGHVLRMAEAPDDALPREIDGKPLPDCLARIRHVFSRYGSPALAADLAQYGPQLAQLAGLSYRQTLDTLRRLEIG